MRSNIPFFKAITIHSQKFKKPDGKTHSPPSSKLISSPKQLTKFAPISPMIKKPGKEQIKETLKKSAALSKYGPNEESKIAKPPVSNGTNSTASSSPLKNDTVSESSKILKSQHVPWIDPSKAKEIALSPNMNTEVIRLPNTIKAPALVQKSKDEKTEILKSPSYFLREPSKQSSESVTYCACGNPCEGDSTLCPACMKNKEIIENSGFLYVKTKSTKLKRYWYHLINKELYCIFQHYC